MAEHNIVVFAGDHCGPEVSRARLPELQTDECRHNEQMLTFTFLL